MFFFVCGGGGGGGGVGGGGCTIFIYKNIRELKGALYVQIRGKYYMGNRLESRLLWMGSAMCSRRF